MADRLLRFVVRTPHAVVIDVTARAARVLTETGHVGLRPRMEAVVVAVEAGLTLLRTESGMRFVGTAGGLLSCDGTQATLFTPLGVMGDDPAVVRAELDRALAAPGPELEVRAALETLENRILTELGRRPGAAPGRAVSS